MENQEIILFLNELLSNEHVLYIKTRNAHWNIIGPDFKSVHVFFEDLYEKFAEDIDSIAERIRKLNSPVVANMRFFVENALLLSIEPNSYDSKTLIQFIYDDLFLINNTIKDFLTKISEDLTTINFLTNLAEENEKTLWFLKSHLD
jgi:starvation-inducible DNA-binding protein